MKLKRGLIQVFPLLWLLACGEDGSAENEPSSGVAADKALSDLSDAEARSLCEFEKRTSQDGTPALEQACTLTAVLRTEAEDECIAERDACADVGTDDNVIVWFRNYDWGCEDIELDFVFEGPKADCDATVADFEGCVNGTVRNYGAAAQKASCDTPDEAPLGPTEECTKLFEVCPTLDRGLFY